MEEVPMLIFDKRLKSIETKLNEIARKIESKTIVESNEIRNKFKNTLWRYFVIGIAKGVGIAIGFTLLGAIIIYFLQKLVMMNLPVIGAFVRDIMNIVEGIERAK